MIHEYVRGNYTAVNQFFGNTSKVINAHFTMAFKLLNNVGKALPPGHPRLNIKLFDLGTPSGE